MSLRALLIAAWCLALSWAIGVNSATAQPVAKADKMVRMTYLVADLVVPIPGCPGPDKSEVLAEKLMQVITRSVAKNSWEQVGGEGTMQYFPMGMGLVIHQRQSVHDEIARLLADLRRLQDVQISVELRLVHVSPAMAKHLLLDMDEHGRLVRTLKGFAREHPEHSVSMDDKQIAALLRLAQSDEGTVITQAPKLTVFQGQKASVRNTRTAIDAAKFPDGFHCDILPVIDADKFVRLSLNLQHPVKAGDAFVVAPDRTLVWNVDAMIEGRRLFVLATPRVLKVEQEERVYRGEARGGAEEQSAPEAWPKRQLGDPKERAIEYRLRQPISFTFKEVPLRQALEDLTVHSGVKIVPDMLAFERAKINLDAPISVSVDDIDMKSALNVMLKKLDLTFVIENQVLIITLREKRGRMTRVTYNVADLLKSAALVEGDAKNEEKIAEALKDLIESTVAKNSWERMGGPGSIQYFPLGKAIVVTQHQEAHEEIALLLASLRKLYEVSVEVETRFVTISTKGAAPWRLAASQPGQGLNPPPRGLVGIDDIHLFMLLEAAQGDRQSHITQAPKSTLLSGQQVAIETKHGPAQWQYVMKPVVTPDRRSVRLDLKVEHGMSDDEKSIQRITKAAKQIEVPDGRTLVWDLGETVERQHLFVVITPRIRVQPQEERIFQGEIERIPGR